jgi:DNA-binding NarL/FixJ family response regulator
MSAESLLLLDDDPGHRLLISRSLKRAFPDLRLVTAGTLVEARGALGSGPVRIALIDINLGHESGLALVSEIRQSHPETFCIVLSTSMLPLDYLSAYAMGADSFVVKSSQQEEFQRDLQSALKFYLAATERQL